MTNATATPSINLNALGIQEMQAAITRGQVTVHEVFTVVEARIQKRIAEKRNLLKPVVEFRNELAKTINDVTPGLNLSIVPTPNYTAAQPHPALPTNPEQLADVVFATVGAANIGAVISRLTARVIGA